MQYLYAIINNYELLQYTYVSNQDWNDANY